MSLIILPFDVRLFAKFEMLFSESPLETVIPVSGAEFPLKFNRQNYAAVKGSLLELKQYACDKGQTQCFNKFFESIGVCSGFDFWTSCTMYKNNLATLFRRFAKLFKLILANTVLLQHFGLMEPSDHRRHCLYFKVDCYKVCSFHSKEPKSRSEIVLMNTSSANVHLRKIIPVTMNDFLSADEEGKKTIRDRSNLFDGVVDSIRYAKRTAEEADVLFREATGISADQYMFRGQIYEDLPELVEDSLVMKDF